MLTMWQYHGWCQAKNAPVILAGVSSLEWEWRMSWFIMGMTVEESPKQLYLHSWAQQEWALRCSSRSLSGVHCLFDSYNSGFELEGHVSKVVWSWWLGRENSWQGMKLPCHNSKENLEATSKIGFLSTIHWEKLSGHPREKPVLQVLW